MHLTRAPASLLLIAVLLAGCRSSGNSTRKQEAAGCSTADAAQALGVLSKDQNDFDAQVKQGNIAQMRALVVQLSSTRLPLCANMASRALGQYMADQVQQMTGTPSAGLANDLQVNTTIYQNEFTTMAAAARPKP